MDIVRKVEYGNFHSFCILNGKKLNWRHKIRIREENSRKQVML